MTPQDQRALCAKLRCIKCKRKPTQAEVTEMVGNFGHKLRASDEGSVRWICLACSRKVQAN